MTRDFTKGARAAFYLMLFVMGSAFWVSTELGHFVMSAEVYGHDVIRLPAELWAACMMVPAGVYLIALYINGKRFWTPYVRLLCGFITASYFSLFVVSAWPAAGGDLMVIASAVLMLKASILGYVDSSELVRQRGWHDRG